MASDRMVTAGHVLRAVMELRRRGSRRALSELEAVEPDLVEHLLEGVCPMHRGLMDLGLSAADARRAYRRAEATALVCVMALRSAHHDLWRDGPAGPPAGPTDDLPPDDPRPDPPV